jgi:hypothetical protein
MIDAKFPFRRKFAQVSKKCVTRVQKNRDAPCVLSAAGRPSRWPQFSPLLWASEPTPCSSESSIRF